jgi:hypothetical protein
MFESSNPSTADMIDEVAPELVFDFCDPLVKTSSPTVRTGSTSDVDVLLCLPTLRDFEVRKKAKKSSLFTQDSEELEAEEETKEEKVEESKENKDGEDAEAEAEEEEEEEEEETMAVYCNGCSKAMEDENAFCYHCDQCEDYDLCEECHGEKTKKAEHNSTHTYSHLTVAAVLAIATTSDQTASSSKVGEEDDEEEEEGDV